MEIYGSYRSNVALIRDAITENKVGAAHCIHGRAC